MKNLLYVTGICVLLILSCSKSTNEGPAPKPLTTGSPVNTKPSNLINIPSDADGVLIASVIPFTFTNNTVSQLGNASAYFYTSNSNFSYIDAGTVQCNDSTLPRLSSGSYNFTGVASMGQSNSGINFAGNSRWTVSSPALSYTATPFPTNATLTSGTLLNKNSNYVMTFNGVTNADSVAIYLACDSVMVKRVVSGSTNSLTFYSSELMGVKKKGSTSKTYFNITPCKLLSTTVSNKKFYFLNATTATFSVNLQ